jgi:hypothetical protein
LHAAIASLAGGPGVVHFPAGTYLLQAPVSLTAGAVLRGQRPGNTTLRFDFNGHCIQIYGGIVGTFWDLPG